MKRVAAALTAAAAAGLGAAYGIYHLAFFQRPKLDIPTAEEWAKGSRFLPQIRENVEFVDSLPCDYVHITADDGTSLSARYCHEADDAPIAIIMHGYRSTAMRDTMGLIVLCKKLGYNLLMPDQRAHGRSDSYTITMGAQERYDARAWAYWASVRSSGKVPIFLMGVSMGAATVLLASGLDLPDSVHGIIAATPASGTSAAPVCPSTCRTCRWGRAMPSAKLVPRSSAALTPIPWIAARPWRKVRFRFSSSTAARTTLCPAA